MISCSVFPCYARFQTEEELITHLEGKHPRSVKKHGLPYLLSEGFIQL